MAKKEPNYPTQEWIDQWIDKYLEDHPNEIIEDFQGLEDQADYEWWCKEIDAGRPTPYDLTKEQEAESHKARVTPGGSGKSKANTERKRKPNDTKRTIISWVKTLFEGFALNGKVTNVIVSNVERSIDFEMDGKQYTLSLTEHRPPKK